MSKTIFVLLDACGYEVGTEYLGYLEHLVDYGMAAKYRVRGELPSMSRPMYETLLTGVPSHVHGITCNEVVRRSNQESVLYLCKKSGLTVGGAVYFWMSELYNKAPFDKHNDRIQFNREGNLIDYGIFYWEDTYPDSHLFQDGEFIRKSYKPDFMMYHPMSIDLAGHTYGADSKEYAWKVADNGCLIADLLPSWIEDGYQVVVTADHGMDDRGIHCGIADKQRVVPLYIISPLAENGHFEDHSIDQRNIAPLLCRLLEIETAKVMIELDEIHLK